MDHTSRPVYTGRHLPSQCNRFGEPCGPHEVNEPCGLCLEVQVQLQASSKPSATPGDLEAFSCIVLLRRRPPKLPRKLQLPRVNVIAERPQVVERPSVHAAGIASQPSTRDALDDLRSCSSPPPCQLPGNGCLVLDCVPPLPRWAPAESHGIVKLPVGDVVIHPCQPSSFVEQATPASRVHPRPEPLLGSRGTTRRRLFRTQVYQRWYCID